MTRGRATQFARHRPPASATAGTPLHRHGHGRGRLRQHRHRLHRHGPLHQQRRARRSCRRIHLHGRRRRAHLHGVTLKTAGVQTVTATDTGDRYDHRHHSSVTVNARRRPRTSSSGLAGATAAGTAHDFTVTAARRLQQHGHRLHGARSTSPAATPGGPAGDYTFTAGDDGCPHLHHGVTLKTPGTRRSPPPTRSTAPSPAPQRHGHRRPPPPASGSGSPAATTAGTSLSVTVTAEDAYDNAATGYTGTVHFTSSDGQAVLPGDYTFTAGDAGAHTFTASPSRRRAPSPSRPPTR